MGTILYIVTDANFFVTHRLPLALAAQRAGYSVAVIGPVSNATAGIRNHGIEYQEVGFGRAVPGFARELTALIRMFSHVAKSRPSVVHLVSIKAAIYGGLICRLLHIPAVIAISGLGYYFTAGASTRWPMRLLLTAALRVSAGHRRNHFIFQNTDDVRRFQDAGILGKATYSIIAGSGVDLGSITPSELPAGPPVVVLPARMLRDKGVCEFVDAARRLRQSGSKARFRLLGDVDPANPSSLTQQQLQKWASGGDIEWSPYDPNIGEVLKSCHIVALPSYREGFPKTLIDAAAAGRACVASDVPGCRDAIQPGETGLLCRPRDAADLAVALKRLIESPTLQEQMGRNARARAEQMFDIRDVCDKHIAIYHQLTRNTSLPCRLTLRRPSPPSHSRHVPSSNLPLGVVEHLPNPF